MVKYISIFPFNTISVTLTMITQLADAGNATCSKFIVCSYEHVTSGTDILSAQYIMSDTDILIVHYVTSDTDILSAQCIMSDTDILIVQYVTSDTDIFTAQQNLVCVKSIMLVQFGGWHNFYIP